MDKLKASQFEKFECLRGEQTGVGSSNTRTGSGNTGTAGAAGASTNTSSAKFKYRIKILIMINRIIKILCQLNNKKKYFDFVTYVGHMFLLVQ